MQYADLIALLLFGCLVAGMWLWGMIYMIKSRPGD